MKARNKRNQSERTAPRADGPAPVTSHQSMGRRGHQGWTFLAMVFMAMIFAVYTSFSKNFDIEKEMESLKLSCDRGKQRAREVEQETSTISWTIPPHIADSRKKECEGRKTSLTGGFCLTDRKHIGGNQIFDTGLAASLAQHVFQGGTVLDLGAGLGHYGKLLLQDKTHPVKSWHGYDGAINVESQTDGLVKFMDLTQPSAIDQRPCADQADWVMSLEVAEHIPPEHTDAFLRNIRCRAKRGAVISWGRPEQTGGLGHINLKTEEQAVEAVERWGFKVDWDLTKTVRDGVSDLEHFRHSTMVYRLP